MELRELPRYWRAISHIEPSQILWRARYLLERKAGLRRRVPDWPLPDALDGGVLGRLRDFLACCARHDPPDTRHVEAWRRGEFSFLNDLRSMPDGPDWQCSDVSRLWLYHLHYFDYVRDLAMIRADDAELVRGWMEDWIGDNSMGASPGWDAFVIASRLLNWLTALSVFPIGSKQLIRSIVQQAAYLSTHIEHDVRANHLLKNAVALVVTGHALGADGAGRHALAVGRPLLERELAEQILADGGHYERSLMYHCHVLEDLLVVDAALGGTCACVREGIAAMTRFLAATLHSDGEIPLFGDAALHTRMGPEALIALACASCGMLAPERKNVPVSLEPSGFYIVPLGNLQARLIVKAGPPGPRCQLGHAHADALSFELTLGSRRVIVDTGTPTYEAGFWRDYCRASRAHNTVCMDERDPLECWGGFRVGRRYAVAKHYWGKHRRGWQLTASHDGLRPWTHRRSVFLCDGCFWVVVDEVDGPESGEATSRLHFHPDVVLDEADGVWRARADGCELAVVPFGVASVERVRGARNPLEGWYCPEFGMMLEADCLILHNPAPRTSPFGYAIVPRASAAMTSEQAQKLAADLQSETPCASCY
ncbi:MAG TPA: hypothetical protein ENN80_00955 [Candidatus Hydrogenedentes bacterium]|nr:hypothetical protein [Candidatus Hydrogenedentota bacterium]